jgi:hypothetical protein
MKLTLENLIAILVLMLVEAWLIKSNYDWEPAIALIVAFGAIFAKEPIKHRFGIGSDSKDHDQRLFSEFLQSLPIETCIHLLKHHDFGDSFRKEWINPLYSFSSAWGEVDKEFIDKSLEKQKSKLYSAAKKLSIEIAGRTVPVGSGEFCSVYSDSQRADGPRPPSVLEDAKVLNQLSREFIPIYESFVRLGKRKLAG